MGNLIISLMFVIMANILMFFAVTAMHDISGADNPICYHEGGTILENIYNATQKNITNVLPEGQATIAPSGGNLFIDIYNNILNWFKQVPGISFIYNIVTAPANLIGCLNMPPEFTLMMNTLWYGLTIIIIIAFMWGRD